MNLWTDRDFLFRFFVISWKLEGFLEEMLEHNHAYILQMMTLSTRLVDVCYSKVLWYRLYGSLLNYHTTILTDKALQKVDEISFWASGYGSFQDCIRIHLQ